MFLLSSDYWHIQKTKEKGRGVFARKKIAAGTIIGDYLGKVIKTSTYDLSKDTKGLYLMYLTDQASIYPNLKKPDIHLFNHACVPNCWMYIYRGHTLFFSLRDIEAGEELTISYLLSPKDETCDLCTHVCRCSSISCSGTMHLTKQQYEKWQRFLGLEKKKTKCVRFVYGKILPKLSVYPTRISGDPMYRDIIRMNIRHI